MSDDTLAVLGALQVDEGKLRGHVDEVVRSRVEETLNGLLDAEADEIGRAQRYERSFTPHYVYYEFSCDPIRDAGFVAHVRNVLAYRAGCQFLPATAT